MGGGLNRAEVVNTKGCSKLFVGLEPMSLSSAAAAASLASEPVTVRSTGPFSGLVICVTGLSKEARKQVMEATERLGGQYSPSLHPQCTHLVVQGVGENGTRVDELNRLVSTASESSCLPSSFHDAKKMDMVQKQHVRFSRSASKNSMDSMLSGHTLYIDSDISDELQNKVLEVASKEGATVIDRWFVGCNASHVVCESNSIHQYIGHSNNIVTPLWVLKTSKDRYAQRLVHMSADLARQIGTLLEMSQNGTAGEENNVANSSQDTMSFRTNASHEERQQIVHLAKTGVRNRRSRRMQTCQVSIRPISPSSLLDSICWSISEPTSTASVFTDSCSGESEFFDANEDDKDFGASFTNTTRSLTESERNELILKNHFLTILFPVNRFSEMGPSARTYFSGNGFTSLQVLDCIYSFYQENMLGHEIEAAIHTDSRHAERLRAVYSSKEAANNSNAWHLTFGRLPDNTTPFPVLLNVKTGRHQGTRLAS